MKFSNRLAEQKMGLVRKLTDEANRLNADDIIYLSIGVPDFKPIECIEYGIQEAFKKGYTKYTATAGLDFVRESVANFYNRKHKNINIKKENILMTAGSQEAIFLLTLCTIDPTDEVIIVSPSFFTFKRCSKMMGAKIIEIPYDVVDNTYQLPLTSIEEKISNKTKYIYINNPNNPTGAFTQKEEMKKLCNIADKYGIHIISDEVYREFLYDNNEFYSPYEFYDKTIIVDSVSKSFSVTGLRVGWIVADEKIIEKLLPAHQQILFSLSSINQYSVYYCFEKDNLDSILEERKNIFETRRNIIKNILNSIKVLETPNPMGAFYIFPKFSDKININLEEFCYDLLYKYHVVVVPGIDFGDDFTKNFRIAYTIENKKLEEGALRIKNYIESKYHI